MPAEALEEVNGGSRAAKAVFAQSPPQKLADAHRLAALCGCGRETIVDSARSITSRSRPPDLDTCTPSSIVSRTTDPSIEERATRSPTI